MLDSVPLENEICAGCSAREECREKELYDNCQEYKEDAK